MADPFNLARSWADFVYLGLFWLALPALCLAAWRWGGSAERVVSVLFVAAVVASKAFKSSPATDFIHIEAGLLIIDAALFAALVTVAIRSGRGWVIWVSAFQLVATLGHFAKLIRPEMTPLAYSLMASASSYPALVGLAVGIVQHRRRAMRGAAGRS